MKKNTQKAIDKYIADFGERDLLRKLKEEKSEDGNVLTIISNSGIHPLNKLHKRGEVYLASEGNLDFSSKKIAELEIKRVLIGVAKKLLSKSWSKIYLVPFGPAVLSMQIKNLVYKITYQDTVDVLHAGNGIHFDIGIDTRRVAVKAGPRGKKYAENLNKHKVILGL